MHLVVIAWLYVALMMAVAEATNTNTNGTVLGAVFTFLLYGLAPVALVVYLMGAPARRKALRAREAAEREAAIAAGAAASAAPDAGGEAPADAVTPVREKE